MANPQQVLGARVQNALVAAFGADYAGADPLIRPSQHADLQSNVALGLAKKDDVNKGGYRWLTVAAAGDATGTELQLALDTSPGAKAFQQALLDSHQPAVMFYTDDVKSDFERIKAHGGDFTMTPTSVTGATIAQLKDNCGNLVQLTQLVR